VEDLNEVSFEGRVGICGKIREAVGKGLEDKGRRSRIEG